jgi:hypothetical protein
MATLVRLVALAGCLLAVASLPNAVRSAQQQAETQAIRNGVLDGLTFSVDATTRSFEGFGESGATVACDAERLNLEAALRFRQWRTSAPDEADVIASRLEIALDRLLKCTPMSGFWWLVRADLAFATGRDQRVGRDYLWASWRTTPREGWIGTLRSRVAMSYLDRLTPDDRQQAISEIRRLLAAGITEHADALLRQGNGPVRMLTATVISELEPANRVQVLRHLERGGISDIWQPVSPQGRPADGQRGLPLLRLPPALPDRPDR